MDILFMDMRWIKHLIRVLIILIIFLLCSYILFTKFNNLKFYETNSIIRLIISKDDIIKINDTEYILYIPSQFKSQYNRYLKNKIDKIIGEDYSFEQHEANSYFYKNANEKVIVSTKQLVNNNFVKLNITKAKL
ncbi:hypothetical protein [Caloranaerobacter ferrireducens]|uniref:hypothetical protein n=1 Tax=Caloranaerobacter ferrireducens TaxID=1323370 RepID=UPI00159F26AE|nr:hypothetical protein [Caloranaerobacter ferrireducens]